MNKFIRNQACPLCKDIGRDSTNNHLAVYSDEKGGWCKIHKYVPLDGSGGGDKQQVKDNQVSISMLNTLPIREYAPRKISQETMEFFGIRTEMNQYDGEPFAHHYPYFSEGEVTAYKTRVLPKDFSRGVTGSIKSFFGEHKTTGNSFLIIVEGEGEACAAREIMMRLKGKSYNVVSLPNGANEQGVLDKVVKSRLEWLSSFKKVVICLDNDIPGRATANALADYLCAHTDVRIAELPLKDTAAMYESDRCEEWGKAINNARVYTAECIVHGSDLDMEELMAPLRPGHMFSFLPNTCKKIHGFRTGEVTTIIAPPNVGKSSLMRQMEYDILANTSDQVGAFFLEETKKKTAQSIIAYHAGIALNRFRQHPELASKELVEDAERNLLPRLHLFEHKLKTLSDDLIERKIEYLVKGVGCKHIFLDHLSFIISGRESGNERKDIDMLLTKLARSVENWDYALYIVSHIKRKYPSPKKKEESYPYWNHVDLDDGRGSGAIEQLSHKMIALENQILDPEQENTRGLLRTRVLRDREWGVIGIGDYLGMDQNGLLKPVQSEY